MGARHARGPHGHDRSPAAFPRLPRACRLAGRDRCRATFPHLPRASRLAADHHHAPPPAASLAAAIPLSPNLCLGSQTTICSPNFLRENYRPNLAQASSPKPTTISPDSIWPRTWNPTLFLRHTNRRRKKKSKGNLWWNQNRGPETNQIKKTI